MPRILVADANSNTQKMAALALKDAGIDVVAVANGDAAIRKLPEFAPDLVLADIFMPVRSGYEVCDFIKLDPRYTHIPVVLLVGAFDPLDQKEAQRVRADGVLKKPFVPPDPLINMVKDLLAKAASERLAKAPATVPAGAIPAANGRSAPKPHAAPSPAAETLPVIDELPELETPFVLDDALNVAPEPAKTDSSSSTGSSGAAPNGDGYGKVVAFSALLEMPAPESEQKAQEHEEEPDLVVTASRDPSLGEPVFWTPTVETDEDPDEAETSADNSDIAPGSNGVAWATFDGLATTADTPETRAGSAEPVRKTTGHAPEALIEAKPAELTIEQPIQEQPPTHGNRQREDGATLNEDGQQLQPEALLAELQSLGSAFSMPEIRPTAPQHAGADVATSAVVNDEAISAALASADTDPHRHGSDLRGPEVIPQAPESAPEISQEIPIEVSSFAQPEAAHKEAAPSFQTAPLKWRPAPTEAIAETPTVASLNADAGAAEPMNPVVEVSSASQPQPTASKTTASEQAAAIHDSAQLVNSPMTQLGLGSAPSAHDDALSKTTEEHSGDRRDASDARFIAPGETLADAFEQNTIVVNTADAEKQEKAGMGPAESLPAAFTPLLAPAIESIQKMISTVPAAVSASPNDALEDEYEHEDRFESDADDHFEDENSELPSFEGSDLADPEVVERIVGRVIERMQPKVIELVTKEILRPVVQALVRREIEKR